MREERQTIELGQGIGRGQHVERRLRESPSNVGGGDRNRADDPVRFNRQPGAAEPAGERRPADERRVRADRIGNAAGIERGQRLGRSGDRRVLEHQSAVHVEQERPHADHVDLELGQDLGRLRGMV